METALIRFLAEEDDDLPELENRLFHPQDLCLSKSGENHIPEVKSRLAEFLDLDSMLDLHLITAFLLRNCHPRDFWEERLEQWVDVETYLPRSIWEKRAVGQWTSVPVLVVNNGGGLLRHFILCRVQGLDGGVQWPEWSDALMDDACKAAIVNAASLAARTVDFPPGEGVYCYPLAHRGCHPFAGGSLGLPLALAMINLMSGVIPKNKIIATGRLDENGNALAIGSLQEKIKRVEKEGRTEFRAVFYPSENDQSEWVENDGVVEAVPVSNLEQARMYEEFYGPGGRQRLTLLSAALEDPQLFVNNCHDLDIRWLDWGDNRQKLASLMEDIAQFPDLFEELLENIRYCSDHHQLELSERLLSLISPALVDKVESLSWISAFKCCSVGLTIANHSGKILAAQEWAGRANGMIDDGRGISFSERVDYYNRQFIGDFHNKFIFQPDLPYNFNFFFQKMEEVAKITSADENMGKLYGSIAQNYGFCGPEHLDETIKFAQKAMKCFGGDQGPAAHGDRQRQLNYMVFAYLDACRWEDAEKTLLKYLEIDALDAVYPLLDDTMLPYHHAVLARFFADQGSMGHCERFFGIVYPQMRTLIKDTHPWQLWAFNLGRVAEKIGRQKEAIELHRESLRLCLLEQGDGMDEKKTILTMALLPLSRLRHIDALSKEDAHCHAQRARDAAAYLNPNHFKAFLDEPDVDKALGLVFQHPEQFFPFTYR